jgi:hypothetical protein
MDHHHNEQQSVLELKNVFNKRFGEATAQAQIGGEPSAPETYDVFRKKFHVPKAWADDVFFSNLAGHSYMVDNSTAAFQFIEDCLKNMGYGEDNDMMIHDYVHFMIVDLLEEAGIPFITEDVIRSKPSLSILFDNLTPDLILKSDLESENPLRCKPLILDVYIGKTEKALNEKKAKYNKLGSTFDFEIIRISNLASSLVNKALSQERVDYLYNQLQVFLTEYAYWKACLKLKKILRNDIENIPIKDFKAADEAFLVKKLAFEAKLEEKAKSLKDFSGI